MMHVIDRVDVVVVGGSSHAVSAAVAARRAGASVFLAAPRTYLGEDLCGTLRLSPEADDRRVTDLAERLFPDEGPATPMHVKKTLDEALLAAGVEFRFACLAAELVRDADGAPCGVVLATRSGREAVLGKVIVDATERASVAELAGAPRADWPAGTVAFERTLILPGDDGPETVVRRIELDLPDGSFRSLALAEQLARDETYTEGQLQAAESLFFVPPDPVACRRSADEWRDEDDATDLWHFRPAGMERLYVLSGCADVPRDAGGRLLRPGGLMQTGERVGVAAAEEARDAGEPVEPRAFAASDPDADLPGRVGECGGGLARDGETLATEPDSPPVLGEFDVVVVGGGTTGVPAAIAAARRGAKVLLAESQYELGGTGTLGLIGLPYHGRRVGFAADVPFPGREESPEHKMNWLRRAVRDAGGEVWLGAIGCGAYVEDGRVRGAVLAVGGAWGVALGKAVIDATGSADVAAAAGAECLTGATEDGCVALQGAGLPPRPLGTGYVNTDYLLTDESDPADVWASLTGARMTMSEDAFDAGPLLQTRERRRVVGDHVLTYLDQIAGRTYRDSIVLSGSDYDVHGYPIDRYFAVFPHDEQSRKAHHPAPAGTCYTPYRCLLPRGLDGVLVLGLGMSMKRDASAMVRMQYDLLNQGYAAGTAAAMAVDAGVSLRDVDVRALQRRLVETGALDEDVLTHEDNFPLPDAAVAEAVGKLTGADREAACRALAVVLSHADAAIGPVREAFEAAQGAGRLMLARVLAAMGDGRGADELIAALDEAEWDEKIFQGRMAEYGCLPTPVDGLVLALGWIGEARGVDAILRKLDQLDADVTLSHHRAVALALEQLGDPRAARQLAELLGKPGMSGHARTSVEPLHDKPERLRRREPALREIVLARALYRCGDADGLGESILRAYSDDLRAILARHARMVLGG